MMSDFLDEPSHILTTIGVLAAMAWLPASGAAEQADNADAKNAVDAYFEADLAFLTEPRSDHPVVLALTALARNHPDAAALLEAAHAETEDPGLQARLATLALREYVADYAYDEAVAAAERLDFDGVLSDVDRVYAGFPSPQAESRARVVEVPYHDGRIMATIGGKDVEVVFDTGAPNIGLQPGLVEELGLTVSRDASRISRVPAYGLEFPVYPVLIDELRIGELILRNLPANYGDIPQDQREAAERLRRETNSAPIIMGLDALRPFVDVVEFDWSNDVVRLIVDDPEPTADPNYVLNRNRGPVVRAVAGELTTRLAIDTGAYGHLPGPEVVESAEFLCRRVFDRGGYSFSETLIGLDITRGPQIQLWSSTRPFAADDEFGVSGVIGKLRSGILRVDMADRSLALRNYQARDAQYDFAPEEVDCADGVTL